MTLNKKILAAAIVGGLFATAAQAQVNLTPTSPFVTVPVSLTTEQNFTAGVLTTSPNAAFNILVNSGYAFSNTEVRYARVECSSNVELNVVGADITLAGATIGNVNGGGTNVIRFSITATGPIATNAQLAIAGTRTFTSRDAVSCSYSLYDLPSQAAAGGTAGRIVSNAGDYANFINSYRYANLVGGATASVSSSPSFSRFVPAPPATTASTGQIGQIRFNLNGAHSSTIPTPLLASGTAVALTDILTAATSHLVEGDFSAAADANGTFTSAGALARVFISDAVCTLPGTIPAVLTATSARFDTGNAAVSGFLCYAPRIGVAIPISSYTIRLIPVSQANFTASAAGPSAVGSIGRDGTTLQAPLVQVPAGYISRIALTNTSGVARPYTFTALAEAGTTIALGTGATGTVPANGTIVLSVADIATFTGQPRGTLNVSIAGPRNVLQGLYQIVNPGTGAISNHVMVGPGTN